MMVHRGKFFNGSVFTGGLTLVELLISLLLGLLLSGGMVSAYLAAKRNYYYEEQMARMQENGRYAMRLISRELVMAGFYGGMPPSAGFTAASVGTDCSDWDWTLDGVNTLDLVNDYTGQSPPVSLHLTEFTCLDPTAIALNTDLIAIKRTAAEASLLRGVPAQTLTSSTIEGWYLRLISGSEPEWEKLRPLDLSDASKALPSLSYWEAITRVIYIRTYSNQVSDDIPSLCMETLAGDEMTSRCLVEGVENLQLEFGIDIDADGVPNQYTSAPTEAEMKSAVAAKIHVLLRSISKISGHRDDKTYRLGQKVLPATHDAYQRRVLSSTVVLRNHIAPTG
jgi:type IV pilus assembly protein PilW